MTQYDVAGILQTYAAKAAKARDKKHLKEILKDLRREFDLRMLEIEK